MSLQLQVEIGAAVAAESRCDEREKSQLARNSRIGYHTHIHMRLTYRVASRDVSARLDVIIFENSHPLLAEDRRAVTRTSGVILAWKSNDTLSAPSYFTINRTVALSSFLREGILCPFDPSSCYIMAGAYSMRIDIINAI